jgi:hypothetical protein
MKSRAVISSKYKFIFLEKPGRSEWWRIVTNDFRYDLEAMDAGDQLSKAFLARFPEYTEYNLVLQAEYAADTEVVEFSDLFKKIILVGDATVSSDVFDFLSAVGWRGKV